MPNSVVRSGSDMNRNAASARQPGQPTRFRKIPFLIAGETILVALVLLAFYKGAIVWTVAVIAIPIHFLLVAVLFRSDFGLLIFFSALYPLSILALLPPPYMNFGLYFGVVVLLVLLHIYEPAVGLRAASWPSPIEMAALLTIGVTACIASLFAVIRGDGFRTAHLLTMSLLLLTAIAYAVVPGTSRQLRMLLRVLLVSYAIACLAIPFFIFRATGFTGGKTFDTLFGTPNLNLVGMVAAACAAIIFGLLSGASGKERLLLILTLAVTVAAVLFSRSRGAWAGVGLAMLYMLIRMRSFKLILILAVIVAVLMTQDILRISLEVRVEQTGAEDPSLLGRFVIWRTAFDMLKDHWLFGVGVENFRRLKFSYGFPRFIDPAYWHGTHNMFLEQFVSLGIFGGIAFLFLPIRIFARLDRLARRRKAGQERGLATGLCAGLLAFSTHCMIDSPGWHRASFVFWGVLLGAALAAVRLLSTESRSTEPAKPLKHGSSSP